MENIKEKLEKEEKLLKDLMEKKKKLEEKIEQKEESIKNLNIMLTQEKFSEITHVIESKGFTLEEIITALQTGNLQSLQEKIKTNSQDHISLQDQMQILKNM